MYITYFLHTSKITCFTVAIFFTLVKFSEISPTRVGSYCQRTSHKMGSSVQNLKLSIFHRKSAACDTGRKFAEYDQRVF
jgi:hypothetical protein